jgi:hypothetical protein
MKTSTTLIIVAAGIMLASLILYNYSLKASYNNGDYKNRYYGLKFAPLKNLNEIHVESANKMAVQIEQGAKEGIWIKEKIADKLKWTVTGGVLNINFTDNAKKDEDRIYGQNIIIVSKKIDRVITHSYFTSVEEEKNGYTSGSIGVNGFRQDNMDLILDNSTLLDLSKTTLNTLNAKIGLKSTGSATLNITSDNNINTAVFSIPGAGTLTLMNPTIVKTSYQLSDEATVTLNGSPLKMLSQNSLK